MAIGCKEVEVDEGKLAFIPRFRRFVNITFFLQNCFYTYEFNFMQRRIPSEKRFIAFSFRYTNKTREGYSHRQKTMVLVIPSRG